ncbi:MAG: hypothetical protein ACKO38_21175 [Planctomycetota bacterium]
MRSNRFDTPAAPCGIASVSSATRCSWRSVRAVIVAMSLSLVFGIVGCGPRGAVDLTLDKELARASLTRFLDAWRDGQPTDQLAKASPAIIGRDPAWADGQKLISYELVGETEGGANLNARIQLKLGGKNSESAGKNAGTSLDVVYVIGTSPVVTVFRDE